MKWDIFKKQLCLLETRKKQPDCLTEGEKLCGSAEYVCMVEKKNSFWPQSKSKIIYIQIQTVLLTIYGLKVIYFPLLHSEGDAK